LETDVRSGLLAIGVLSLLLAACARIPTPQEANDAVMTLRDHESWAWALGIALIWGDLVLPVPQTAVIAALGIIYGTLLGGLLGSLGLITGGLLGYVLMRTSARRYVQRLVGAKSLHTMERVFDRSGAWAIVLTRSLPYSVPEAMVFLAGLAGIRVCSDRRWLGGPADPGPRGKLYAPHPPATHHALSHAGASIVRSVNTGHRSPDGLPAGFCGTHAALQPWASWSAEDPRKSEGRRPSARGGKPLSLWRVLPFARDAVWRL
jgi:hypothetical protein